MCSNHTLAKGTMALEIGPIHPGMANVSKAAIMEDMAKKLKSSVDRMSVFGLKTKFGGGSSSGFALIYNSLEDKK